jgi:hypothetical protein
MWSYAQGRAHRDRTFDLDQETVAIVGQGNMAADVCRILAKPVDELRSTDIAERTLDALARSRVREIHVIGPRGPVQAKVPSGFASIRVQWPWSAMVRWSS